MADKIIPDRLREEYRAELKHVFRIRTNLFCYVTIAALVLELILAFTAVRGIIGPKDNPGIIGGIIFSVFLLATDRIKKPLRAQKSRAFFFSICLIAIAVLAAVAHPEIITYLGITLILLAMFTSTLLLPWNAAEVAVISAFAILNFLWIYGKYNICVNRNIFEINIAVLAVASAICIIVKRSEDIMRRRDFVLKKEIEDKNRIMMKELELAQKIHSGLIPKSISTENVDIAVTYKPMLYIGGDYAKFHFPGKNKLLFIIADITGHGVSAALLVNRMHTEIETLLRENILPGELLKRLDDFIKSDFGQMGIYLSAFCGLLDFADNSLIYSNYGHPPQILFQRAGNKIVFMEAQTFLMGIGMETPDVHQIKLNFSRGDRILLFTDGLIETKNISGEEFGYDRLKEFVKDNSGLNVLALNEGLVSQLAGFQSGEQKDDIFLLSVQIK